MTTASSAPISTAAVMQDAWRIARAAVAEFGGKVREFFGPALRQAWAAARKPTWSVLPNRSAGLISHRTIEGVLVVAQKTGQYPRLVRSDGVEMHRAARIEIMIRGSTILDVSGARETLRDFIVRAYTANGNFRTIHDATDYRSKAAHTLASLVAEAESHIPAALAAISGIDAEFASAHEIIRQVHADFDAETMTRERYVALADKWDFFAEDDCDLSTWGDFRYPEQKIDSMPRLLINQRRAFQVDREKKDAADKARREKAEDNQQRMLELASRPVVRTYTRKAARWSPRFLREDGLHTVVSNRCINTVTEDHPSLYGSHLLGCEGEPFFELTVEVRA